ncbi:MAG: CDGSH iron-sulfur domain-containing protein [Rickettsiales bacterium]|nr:CDGSH iron-sulfur domain-containing protein [Rickettsiales bacterium]
MKSPIKFNVEKGKTYPWCSCGFSETQPFCNGMHRDNDTSLKSLKYTASESKTVYFCTCKKTKNPPFCDGSHSK